jgi:hypothetical protein
LPDTEELPSEVQIEKNLVIPQKSEAIIQDKQPQLILVKLVLLSSAPFWPKMVLMMGLLKSEPIL